MILKFFLYKTKTGEIILGLSALPDNIDFYKTGDILFNGKYIMKGIKFENISILNL